MIRIGLLGSSGRMGQWVKKLVETEYKDRAQLSAAVDRDGGSNGLADLLQSQVVIDFSVPAAMNELARAALASKSASLPSFVVGSTGWSAAEKETLSKLGSKTPVLISSNFSTGVLALMSVLRQAAPMLEKLGYTPVLIEKHHRHKKDSPSGTAIALQGCIRPSAPQSVQTHAVRAGEVIGDHEVLFYGAADHLTFGHFAQDRSIFARGAIDVALWLASKPVQGVVGIETYWEKISESLGRDHA